MNFQIEWITHQWFYPNLTLSFSCATFFFASQNLVQVLVHPKPHQCHPLRKLTLSELFQLPKFHTIAYTTSVPFISHQLTPHHVVPKSWISIGFAHKLFPNENKRDFTLLHNCGKTLDLTWNQMCLVIVVDLTTLGYLKKTNE